MSIEDVPDPVPGDDEILVDVKACGDNFTDLLSLDGKYQNNPYRPSRPARTRPASSSCGCKRHQSQGRRPGDRPCHPWRHGGKTVCPAALAFPLPDGVDYDAAAAMGRLSDRLSRADPPWTDTSWRGSADQRRVRRVGLASVNLAKALGAKTVLAGLTTPSKGDAVAASADTVIDLTADDLKDNLRAQVMAATDKHGIDLAFDLVGGEVFDATLRAIANEGRVVVSGLHLAPSRRCEQIICC